MKLKVFDRILLAILLIVAIVASFVLFGIAANVIKQDVAQGFLSLFYEFPRNAWILAGSGFLLLLISVKLLFAGKSDKTKREIRPASALMKQTDVGGTFISLEALDSMVQRHVRAQTRVRDCHTTLQSGENGVTIGIRLAVLPDTDVVSLTAELQNSLKQHIESLTGITVNEIGVLIENATAQPAARVE